jgi:hypothetical protein
MGWVEALVMSEVRSVRRCWVYVGGVEEDVVVVRIGGMYVIGLSDDWYAVSVDAVKRFLARWFNVDEEEVSLEC